MTCSPVWVSGLLFTLETFTFLPLPSITIHFAISFLGFDFSFSVLLYSEPFQPEAFPLLSVGETHRCLSLKYAFPQFLMSTYSFFSILMRLYIYTHIHIYTHTYIYTCTYLLLIPYLLFFPLSPFQVLFQKNILAYFIVPYFILLLYPVVIYTI